MSNLRQWLNTPCDISEMSGNEAEGLYLSKDAMKAKLKKMEDDFGCTINHSNFNHILFNRIDKEVFCSGSMEFEIIVNEKSKNVGMIGGSDLCTTYLFKRIVGAYSFNISDYDRPPFEKNEQYAGTLKTLCMRNAFSNEYPQFGSHFYVKELVVKSDSKKGVSVDDKVKKSIDNLMAKK